MCLMDLKWSDEVGGEISIFQKRLCPKCLIQLLWIILLCPPTPHSWVATLIPSVTLFGGGVFGGVIRVRQGREGGAPGQDKCPYKRRKRPGLSRTARTQQVRGRAFARHQTGLDLGLSTYSL